jgi:hypothetical protein
VREEGFMSENGSDQLEDVFKRAAAVAATMPPALQEVAFNRALDALLRPGQSNDANRGTGSGGPQRSGPGGTKTESNAGDDAVEALLALPRNLAEEVDDEEGALGKALALLTVAERELGIESLTAPNIAEVLTRKFKWRVSRQAITQALDRAGKMVDSKEASGGRRYTIMAAGSRYLATPAAERQAPAVAAVRRGRKSSNGQKATAGRTSNTTDAAEPDGKKTAALRRSASRPGPKEAIQGLIDSGYFGSPRLLGNIRDELRDRRGLSYKSTDLSPVMVRLLREGRLKRRRNEDAQYEYVEG